MSIKLNLVYYEENIRYGNFGDELSKFITKNLIDNNKYELVFNKQDCELNIICIGSYISKARNGYHIFGSGVIHPTKAIYDFTQLNVYAVRGPKTRQFLLDKGINCPEIYGDPALLVSKYYTPKNIGELNNKIGVIPHYTKYKNYINIDQEKYQLIDACDKFENVLDQIYSCKCIISSSLHGLICSDAYNKPNILLNDNLKYGLYKFEDYFKSQNRPHVYIESLEQFDEKLLYCDGNIIDLDLLISVFPFN